MSSTPLVELDANPLTAQSLYDALSKASSSNLEQLQGATKQLILWEKQPGFYSNLQTIFINTGLPFEIRYLSAIQFKNGIDKYWRKTAANAIGKEEKAVIRSRCLESGVNEADTRLALQNAIVVAKIVRHEFPGDWPDAITAIVRYLRDTALEDGGSLHLPRTLLILLYIVKELSTARLQRSRVSLQKAAPEILQVLGTVYVDKVRHWMAFLQNGSDNEGRAISSVDVSLLALRILRRLLIVGFEHPNRHQEVQQFWSIIRAQFGEMISLLMQDDRLLGVRVQIEKHLIQMSKLHLKMVQDHPAAFPQLPGSIDVAKSYWQLLLNFSKTFGIDSDASIGTDGDAEEEIPCIEKLSLKGLLLLRACVKMVYNPTQTFKYQHAEDKEERQLSKEAMKVAMLSAETVREMMDTLVTRFFVFCTRDLKEWEEEPSEWERRGESEGEAWEFSIRVCAEKLFLDLVINNKDLLIQPLLQLFYTVATPDNPDAVRKDSIYAAIGLAAPILHEQLDFDTFLRSTLVQEVQINKTGYNILRRRIAILLGQWVLVKNIDRPLVYNIFEFILDKTNVLNDLVVRVTAGRQMKNVIDPWDMQIETFLPHAELILGRIITLVEEVDLVETKLALLDTISTIVIRMEHHVVPFADGIISLLPPLWDQSEDEHLTKQVIFGILTALVTSMKGDSQRFHNLILPLIESSIQPQSETREYLLEEALDLWSAILAQTIEPSPEILNLRQYLFPLYESASEMLRKALQITDQYILLAPPAMLEQSPQYTAVFRNLISSKLGREANGIVVHLVDTLLQVGNVFGGPTAVQHLAGIIDESNFLPEVLLGLKSSYDAHQTTGPNKVHTDIEGIVESDYFTVVARILLIDTAAFVNVLEASTAQPFDEAIDWLLTECFSHCENIGNTDQKKLMCLALTNLLDLSPSKKILNRLQEFMHLWCDTVAECTEYLEDGDEGRDTLIYSDPDALRPEKGVETPEDERRRNLLFSDPVHKIHIKEHIKNHLLKAMDLCGGQGNFQNEYLVNVDAEVVKSFSSMRIL